MSLARLLAHHFPDRVRQVVTLGSPIGRPGTPASRAGRGDMGRLRALVSDPLPGVPGTAVYSRTDGIVPWQIARQAPSEIADNVEVYGSHIGLGFNASALYLLAERLALPTSTSGSSLASAPSPKRSGKTSQRRTRDWTTHRGSLARKCAR